MNRKGQIAVATLVVIAIALSGLAIYAMITFKNNLQEESNYFSDLPAQAKFAEGYVTAQAKIFGKTLSTQCSPCSEQKLSELSTRFEEQYNLRMPLTGNFFAKIRNNEFAFVQSDEKNTLRINDIFVEPEKEGVTITKHISLCLEFNKEGEFLTNCQIETEE